VENIYNNFLIIKTERWNKTVTGFIQRVTLVNAFNKKYAAIFIKRESHTQ